MLIGKAILENGKIKIVSEKTIDQSTLTSDCLLIQFHGLSECEKCECRNTRKCGGGKTLQKMFLASLPPDKKAKNFLEHFQRIKPKQRF